MPIVTVLVPNYNGKEYLTGCLDALSKQTFNDFDVMVVDDASTDGSADAVSRYSFATLVKRSENGGFCKAVNDGVSRISSKYVILLNNDTVPDTGFVEGLYKNINSHPGTFSVSAKMLDAKNVSVLDGAGDLYNIVGWAFARGKGQSAAEYDKEAKVFSSCGGAAIYDREKFVEMGGLDENHIAYLEDLDIGYRARLNGLENRYEPTAVVTHIGSASTGSRYNSFKTRISARNNVYVIYKNMPLAQFIANAPFIAFGFLVKYAFFMRKGMGREYAEGIKEGKKLMKSPEGKARKQRFAWKRSGAYFKIQMQLWKNLFHRHG